MNVKEYFCADEIFQKRQKTSLCAEIDIGKIEVVTIMAFTIRCFIQYLVSNSRSTHVHSLGHYLTLILVYCIVLPILAMAAATDSSTVVSKVETEHEYRISVSILM
jgi:lipid-A-disaccharide synthase-like uncharacterized protein